MGQLKAVKYKKALPPDVNLASLGPTIEERGRMYCLQYGPWISNSALETSTHPFLRVEPWSPDCFASPEVELDAEVEQMFRIFDRLPSSHGLPEELVAELTAIIGKSPWFRTSVCPDSLITKLD